MADAYIQVAPDDSGKKLQTFQNTISGQVVQAEAVTLVTSAGTEITSLNVALPTVARTPASAVVSSSGSVAAGKQSVQFIPSSDFTGTLLGAAWPGTNATLGFSVVAPETIGAIAYTVTTGSITILTLT